MIDNPMIDSPCNPANFTPEQDAAWEPTAREEMILKQRDDLEKQLKETKGELAQAYEKLSFLMKVPVSEVSGYFKACTKGKGNVRSNL